MDKKKAKGDFYGAVEVTKIKSSLPPKIIEPNQSQEFQDNQDNEPESYITPGDRQKHCIEILSEGFVRSYVDFFYLTHRPDPIPELYNISSEPTEIAVPARELIEIRSLLTTAEEARRNGDSQKVFSCYGNLANYYENKNDLKTCLFFNEKCLELSRITHDVMTEMESCHRLGLVYDKNRDEDTAISYHEDHLNLAEGVNDRKHIVQAHETLYGLYERKAIRYEKEGNLLQALDYYKKCLISSTGASNEIWESQCNYRIGKTLNHLNRCDESIQYLVNFLNIARRLQDMKSQGQACAALAAAHQSLGQQDKAEEYLLNFLELAEALKDLIAQSDACYSLGVINNKRGYFDEAVKFFTRNYELLRQLVKDKKCDVGALDNARFALGMAKGNQRTNNYINIIRTNINKLLDWKISRLDIIN